MAGLMWIKRRRACQIGTRTFGDWTVLEVCGKFVAGAAEKLFHEHVDRLLADGSKRVIVDLTGSLLADESVAQAAPAAYHRARAKGVDLRFVVPPGRAGGYYHMAGLEMTIPTFQRLHGAIEM